MHVQTCFGFKIFLLFNVPYRRTLKPHGMNEHFSLIYSCFSRDHVPTNNIALIPDIIPNTTHDPLIRLDEGLGSVALLLQETNKSFAFLVNAEGTFDGDAAGGRKDELTCLYCSVECNTL